MKTDIFSNTFNEDQRDDIITKLLGVCFKEDYMLAIEISSTDEATYKEIFKEYLFNPICEYVAAILYFEINVRFKNTAGRTGVNTKVPHQSNDIFHSHPIIVAYGKWKHRRSLAIVEVKKVTNLERREGSFTKSRMVNFYYSSCRGNVF